MKDLILIITNERKTLLRGFIISFLIAFPFTFIPPIFRKGFSLATVIERFNESTLYAAGFALLVVFAAVIHNYNSLVEKKWFFEKPAFKNLDFHGRLDGIGSISRELETFLLGEIDGYFFRLGLPDPEAKNPKLEIIPLIKLNERETEKTILRKEYGFRQRLFFGKTLPLKDFNLEDPISIQSLLQQYAAVFKDMKLEAMEVDHTALEH